MEEIRFTKPVSDMTADELAEARRRKLPIYCQTMARRSRVHPHELVFSDVEELTPENLASKVEQMKRDGWREDGVRFVRKAR